MSQLQTIAELEAIPFSWEATYDTSSCVGICVEFRGPVKLPGFEFER